MLVKIKCLTQCYKTKSFLRARTYRHELVETLQIRLSKTYYYDGRDASGAKEMAGFVSKFPSLTRLVVDLIRLSERSPGSPVSWWQVALAPKLESTRLSVCTLRSSLASQDNTSGLRCPN